MSNFFRKESFEYQKNQLCGQVLLTQPLLYRLLTYAIVLLMCALVLYIYFGKMNRKAEVVGYLEPTVGVMRYTAPLQGYVRQICVCEHQWVAQGEQLMSVVAEHHLSKDQELYRQRQREIEQRQHYTKEQIALLDIQKQEKRIELETERSGLKLQLEQVVASRKIATQQCQLADKKLANLMQLYHQGAVAQVDIDQQQAAVWEHQATLSRLNQTEVEICSRCDSIQIALAHLETSFTQKQKQLALDLSRLNTEYAENTSQCSYWLTASQPGQVTRIYAHLGDQVPLGAPLLNLLPNESTLEAVMLVPSESIGFVEPQQQAKIKLDAFPFQRFGFQTAEITQVAQHVLLPQELNAPIEMNRPAYRIRARLTGQSPKAFGQHVLLKPGMTFKADVILDQHPIWMWLFEPLLSLRGNL